MGADRRERIGGDGVKVSPGRPSRKVTLVPANPPTPLASVSKTLALLVLLPVQPSPPRYFPLSHAISLSARLTVDGLRKRAKANTPRGKSSVNPSPQEGDKRGRETR